MKNPIVIVDVSQTMAPTPEPFFPEWDGEEIEAKFPHWLTARAMMTQWIDSIQGFDVRRLRGSSNVLIEPLAPAPLIAVTPKEDWAAAALISSDVMALVVGDAIERIFSGGAMIPLNEAGFAMVRAACENAERERLAQSGRGLQYEMALAFGIHPLRYLR